MKVGDLVENEYGMLGIIMWQVGVVDRWMIHWYDGEQYAWNGCNLFLITDKKCP
jgi:hypothetical protein